MFQLPINKITIIKCLEKQLYNNKNKWKRIINTLNPNIIHMKSLIMLKSYYKLMKMIII